MRRVIHGIPAAPGRLKGKAKRLPDLEDLVPKKKIKDHEVDFELARLDQAIASSRREIRDLLPSLPDIHKSVFEAHLLLYDDPMLVDEAKKEITTGKNAQWAISHVIHDIKARLQGLHFEERATDLEDAGNRILANLSGKAQADPRVPFLQKLPENTILIVEELPPSLMLHIYGRKIAILAERGGVTGHMAILARERGIPAVISIDNLLNDVEEGKTVIVDGSKGEVIVEPSQNDLEEMARALAIEKAKRSKVQKPFVLQSGERIYLYCNLEDPSKLKPSEISFSDGIGLFRSEFSYSMQHELLTERIKHEAVYEQLFKVEDCTIRLIDTGGDKADSVFLKYWEGHTALPPRGLAFLLASPALLQWQLEGILSVAGRKKVKPKVLIPLVSSIEEARAICNQIATCTKDFPASVEIGFMLETPASCLMADALSEYADFFSFGTNDLAAFLLGAERANVSEDIFYQPSVIRAIHIALSKSTKPFSICGEMASMTSLLPLLIGLGLRRFSMSLLSIPDAAIAIKGLNLQDCEKIAQKALHVHSVKDLKELLGVKE